MADEISDLVKHVCPCVFEFSNFRSFIAENGERIGLVNCLRCGASILLDPADEVDTRRLHIDWHQANGY